MTKEQFNAIAEAGGFKEAITNKWVDMGQFIHYFALSGDSSIHPDGRVQQMFYDEERSLFLMRSVLKPIELYRDQPLDNHRVLIERNGRMFYTILQPGGIMTEHGLVHDIIPLDSISIVKVR